MKLISESYSIDSQRSAISELRRRGSRLSSSIEKETSTEVKATTEQSGELIENETAAVGSVEFGVYLRYFRSIGFLLFFFMVIFVMSSEASSVMSNRKKLLLVSQKYISPIFFLQFGSLDG